MNDAVSPHPVTDSQTVTQIQKPAVLPWPPLLKGTLIRRYKRFLADIRLETGEVVTAHCANSGAMTHCCEPGRAAWLSWEPGPKRKLAYTWYVIEMASGPVGVHTQIPNRLVPLAIRAGHIPELSGYETLEREVSTKNARMDLRLSGYGKTDCFVEIKNCTQIFDRMAAFPDAVTTRGKKHMEELALLVEKGHRAVVFFLVQREEAKGFRPAGEIDPAYARALRQAHAQGVEVLCYDVRMDFEGIRIQNALPVFL